MILHIEQKELRDLNYPIYLCTSFAPLIFQPLLQDLMSLFCQLTIAATQPTEKMLSNIRVQWWIDCIRVQKGQNSPLLDRIIAHIHDNRLNKEKLLFILEIFHSATFEDSTEELLETSWSAVFDYYCCLSGNQANDSTGLLGSLVSYIIYKPIKLEQLLNNRKMRARIDIINSIETQDGFIKSCAHLLYLSKNKKLHNYTLLPMRLFFHILFKRKQNFN